MTRSALYCLAAISLAISLQAQDPDRPINNAIDSLIYEEDHIELFTEISTLNPKRAALLSAVLPGLGQVYNKQYWRVPFVIGGGVILGHYIKYQDRLYNSFRSALIAETDVDPRTANPFTGLTKETLEANVEKLRRSRDYLMIITTFFYFMNIIDAHISAHLNEFQINEQLSMDIQPTIQTTSLDLRSVGVSFSLKF